MRRLGALHSLVFLSEETALGGRLLYYRAEFEGGRFFLRVLLDGAGKIADVQGDRV